MGSIASSRDFKPTVELSSERRSTRRMEQIAKRTFDIVFSLLALVFISPVLIAVAILIKLDSEGPVLYISSRIGKDGKRFRFYKFRTMVKNAESLRGNLLHLNERDGHLFKMSNDPRVTRLGKLLRRYSLDELPQFFSVLTGKMSVVGPRPGLMCEYIGYTEEQRRRVEAVPGVTGLWQVEARRDPSSEAYFERDLYYVDNWSLWLDAKILLKTIAVVLAGTGE